MLGSNWLLSVSVILSQRQNGNAMPRSEPGVPFSSHHKIVIVAAQACHWPVELHQSAQRVCEPLDLDLNVRWLLLPKKSLAAAYTGGFSRLPSLPALPVLDAVSQAKLDREALSFEALNDCLRIGLWVSGNVITALPES